MPRKEKEEDINKRETGKAEKDVRPRNRVQGGRGRREQIRYLIKAEI